MVKSSLRTVEKLLRSIPESWLNVTGDMDIVVTTTADMADTEATVDMAVMVDTEADTTTRKLFNFSLKLKIHWILKKNIYRSTVSTKLKFNYL